MPTKSIVSIVYKPISERPKEHFSRVALEKAQLIAGHGIEGDTKGGHPKRQLNIMSAETLETLTELGFNTAPGELGEQIIITGVQIDTLKPGDQLRLGKTAVVEVVEPRTGCDRFASVQSHVEDIKQAHLGIIARVLTDGQICVGDAVYNL